MLLTAQHDKKGCKKIWVLRLRQTPDVQASRTSGVRKLVSQTLGVRKLVVQTLNVCNYF